MLVYKMIFAFQYLEYPELCLAIVLSLTACEKSNCFAVSMFDERTFPYLPQGGIQMFRGHLPPPALMPRASPL